MFKYSKYAFASAAVVLFSHAALAQQTMAPSQPSDAQRAAAMQATAPRHPELKPVFRDFGGQAGLVALVDDFMVKLMADPRTKPYFANVDREHVKKMLVLQFCVILGGPCTYVGNNMKAEHRGMGVDRADFNALVEDLQQAMDARDIPFRSQNKLLAVLATMHDEIISQ